jgi:hypothetical protein
MPHKRELKNAKDRKVAKEVGIILEKTVQNKLQQFPRKGSSN